MANSEVPRVLLDSSALLAVIKNEPGSERLDGLMEMITHDKAQVVESVLVLGEVYKQSDTKDGAERARQDQKLDEIRKLLKSRQVMLLDVTPPIVEKATEFRLSLGLKLADAVHLATAVLNRCDWLVTFDKDFRNANDLTGLRTFRVDHLRVRSTRLPWELAVQDELPGELG